MRKSNKTLIFIIGQLFCLFWLFIKKAYYRGRILEWFISTFLICGSWYMLYTYNVVCWWYLIPACIYAIYWIYLFSVEKITSDKANSNWADREWWWKLDGWEFEEEAAKIFRLNGYKATVTKKTGDGGIDIILEKDKKKVIVQCKHYSSAVAPEVLRALWGVREDFRTEHVMLIASSGISKSSKDFIKNKPTFKVLDLEDLIRLGLRPSENKY